MDIQRSPTSFAMNVAGISATSAIGEMLASRETALSPAIDSDSDKISEDGFTERGSSINESANEGDVDVHITPEYVPGCFEGPEKTLEVTFKPRDGDELGLRALSREQLDTLCTKAKCTILSKISSSHMDAYVLSESSLFIYKHKYIMKTCGTTTLLRALSTLLEYADALGMELTWVGYSRKNLLFPSAQLWPHSNFGDEIKYISSHDKLQNRLKGSGYILGPITGDHWFVYVADHSDMVAPSMMRTRSLPMFNAPAPVAAAPSTDRTVNLMMFDMAPEVSKIFFKSTCETGRDMTIKAGIDHLCPGATIDETAFTPCGYSMNAILHDAYFTIHITPEKECSYASFETNTSLPSYASMIRNVLNVFRPQRFVLTMFGDESAVDSMLELPTDPKKINVPGHGVFSRTSLASTKVETDLCCLMGCYSLDPTAVVPPATSAMSVSPSTAPGLRSHHRTRSAEFLTDMY